MFNLQANAYDIGKGIASDLDMEMVKIGIAITSFTIQSVSYPEEVAKMQQKAADRKCKYIYTDADGRCAYTAKHSSRQHGRQYGWYADGYGNGSDDGPDDERQYAE